MKSKRKYSLFLIAFWIFVAAITFAQGIVTNVMQDKEINLKWHLIGPISWLVWILLTPFVVLIIRKNPLKWGNVKAALLRIFVIIVAISTIHIILYIGVLNLYWSFDTGKCFPWQAQLWFLCPQTFTTNFLVLVIIIGITMAIDNYFLNRDLLLKSSQLETQLAQAKIAALRRQLQPHFLFNTLNALNTLILRKDHEKAERMLNKLSALLRESIESNDEKWITMEEELRISKLYLDIHEVRFGDRLKIEYQVSDGCTHCKVPNFLLQPYIENALNHGIGKNPGNGEIKIIAHKEGDRLQIEVVDNGPGANVDEIEEGVGLGNTRDRLTEMFGKDVQITYETPNKGGFLVRVSFPCPNHDCKQN